MTDHAIHLHADELEYTSTGLRVTGPIPLQLGVHNRVVIQRPVRVRPVPLGRGGFANDSSFPTPTALMVLLSPVLQSLLDPEAKPFYQVYGHTQSDGNEADNKRLSDRRAAVLHAMLLGDVDAVQAVADEEGWGPLEHQVMLRMLRCDPGLIDGEVGPLTSAAVTDFQEEYVDGVFHRHGERQPRDPALVADGKLGPKTAKALVDAVVTAFSPFVDPAQIHPTHPRVGCSEFNPVPGTDPADPANRRASLVVHEALPPFHDRAPCTQGDHSVCPVDQEAQRCLWYRAHVEDEAELATHLHIDLRWLPLADGRVLLSALTSLADDDPVELQVMRSGPVGGPGDVHEGNLGEPLSEVLAGRVTRGVAQVVWTPPEGSDPYDFDSWFPALGFEALRENPSLAWSDEARLRPPVFVVRGGGATAVSEPPGQDLHRLRLANEDGTAAEEGQTAWAVDSYGRTLQVDLRGRRVGTEVRATQEPVRVLHFEPLQYRPLVREAKK